MVHLGYDIGSSSIKAALVEADSGNITCVMHYPETEMDIQAPEEGWAEQDPNVWWDNVCHITRQILQKSGTKPSEVQSIGIAYQMHGLVLVDKNLQVLRPSIIWCDSRAVDIGRTAFEAIGPETCISRSMNSPGNFTASKWKWVKDNEPEVYEKIYKVLLPGDFIAMKFTGKPLTTVSGLSEGILWDFQDEQPATFLLDAYNLDHAMLPEVVDTFSHQGELTSEAAGACGLAKGTPVTYRAGDQPNNALSLGVFQPGEVAATGGTSGVVYGVVDRPISDPQMRVNGFAHVNHQAQQPRIGMLLCINGAGILYSWIRKVMGPDLSYAEMEKLVASVPINSEGVQIIPFGNGSERMLEDKNPGASIHHLQLTRHGREHLFRAALEGIAYSFHYGLDIMRELGMQTDVIRVGNDNLFQSNVFATTISNLSDCKIEVRATTGAAGAARASAIGLDHSKKLDDIMGAQTIEALHEPTDRWKYLEGYEKWKSQLETQLDQYKHE